MHFNPINKLKSVLPCPGLNWSRYSIVHSERPGYQLWHRPLKMASLVYEREIGVGAAAMHDLHVIQGPKCYAWCAWENSILCIRCIRGGRLKISVNRVKTKLYNCGACVCKSNAKIRIAGSFCRPQLNKFKLTLQHFHTSQWTRTRQSLSTFDFRDMCVPVKDL